MLLHDVKHLLINLRQEGVQETVRRFCFRFLRINSFYVFSLDLAQFDKSAPDRRGVVIEEVSLERLVVLREQYNQLPAEFYIDQLDSEKKHRCFICFVDEAPALIIWLCPGGSSGFVNIGSGEIEMNHILCRSNFRGKNLLQFTICKIVPQILSENYSKIITVVHSGNIASIKSIDRCGFEIVGTLKRFGLFVWNS